MTDRTRAVRRRKPSAATVFLASMALFVASLGFLALQLAQGNDPSLGAGALTLSKPQQPVVTVRKVIKRHVITTVIPNPAVTTVASTGSYSTGGSSAPITTSAPAPAPAAPVVSSSS